MIFTSEQQLTPGKWYAVGFRDMEGDRIDWASARLLKYEGEGEWSDEDGPVEQIWDPIVQAWILPGAADAFALQS